MDQLDGNVPYCVRVTDDYFYSRGSFIGGHLVALDARFGIQADGSDETAEITALLNYANSVGKSVYFPAGIYGYASSTMPYYTSIWGDGYETELRHLNSSGNRAWIPQLPGIHTKDMRFTEPSSARREVASAVESGGTVTFTTTAPHGWSGTVTLNGRNLHNADGTVNYNFSSRVATVTGASTLTVGGSWTGTGALTLHPFLRPTLHVPRTQASNDAAIQCGIGTATDLMFDGLTFEHGRHNSIITYAGVRNCFRNLYSYGTLSDAFHNRAGAVSRGCQWSNIRVYESGDDALAFYSDAADSDYIYDVQVNDLYVYNLWTKGGFRFSGVVRGTARNIHLVNGSACALNLGGFSTGRGNRDILIDGFHIDNYGSTTSVTDNGSTSVQGASRVVEILGRNSGSSTSIRTVLRNGTITNSKNAAIRCAGESSALIDQLHIDNVIVDTTWGVDQAVSATNGTGCGIELVGTKDVTINAEIRHTGVEAIIASDSSNRGYLWIKNLLVDDINRNGATTKSVIDMGTRPWKNVIRGNIFHIGQESGGQCRYIIATTDPQDYTSTTEPAMRSLSAMTFETGLDAAVDTVNNTLTVPTNQDKWITGTPIYFTLDSGTITGLTSGTIYYLIRASSTTVKLATTYANASTGTEIALTAKSSPVWRIINAGLTDPYTGHAYGDMGGEALMYCAWAIDANASGSTELVRVQARTASYLVTKVDIRLISGSKGSLALKVEARRRNGVTTDSYIVGSSGAAWTATGLASVGDHVSATLGAAATTPVLGDWLGGAGSTPRVFCNVTTPAGGACTIAMRIYGIPVI